MQLQLTNLTKSYGEQTVLSAVSLHLEQGQIGALLGASGSGKTTLLRCIAGFEAIDDGQIILNEGAVNTSNVHVAPHRRGVGMVFQDHALFGHLSVAQNVEFGLHKLPRAEQQRRVHEVLELVGLLELRQRYPHQLSGGQQQRAALARAMAPQPRLLLLDEPFASLDRDLRERLTADVSQILRHSDTTALWVTHDPIEAMRAADTVGVMHHGQLLQWDSPESVYQAPQETAVAELTGKCSWLSVQPPNNGVVDTPMGNIAAVIAKPSSATRSNWRALVRPEHLTWTHASPSDQINARVSARWYHGARYLYELTLADGNTVVATSSDGTEPVGADIALSWNTESIRVFADN